MPRSSHAIVGLEAALHAAGSRVERIAERTWRVAAHEQAIEVRVRMASEEWLEVVAWDPGLTELDGAGGIWPLLTLNERLDGFARLACGRRGLVEIRAELFAGLDGERASDPDGLAPDLTACCHDLLAACVSLRALRPDEPDRAPDTPPCLPDDVERLASLCVEAGWTVARHDAGAVLVVLDPSSPHNARLAVSSEGRLRAVVPLAGTPPSSAVSREAIALLLLRASSVVRGVKGVAIRDGDAHLPAIASVCGQRVHSPDAMLSALDVACRLVEREVQALEDSSLARSYLSAQLGRHLGAEHPIEGHQLEDTPCLQLP